MTRSITATTLAGAVAVLAFAAVSHGAEAQERERRGPPGDRPAAAAPSAGTPAAAPTTAPPASAAPAPAGAPSRPTPAMANTGATGSYLQSCRSSTVSGGRLFSECSTGTGQYRRSSIEVGRCVGDIGNQNGILGCNGAIAQDGGLVVETPAATANDRGGRADPGRGTGDHTGSNSGYGRGTSSGSDRGGGYGDVQRDDGRSRGYDNRDNDARSYNPRSADPRGYDQRGYGSPGYGAPGYGGQGYGDRGDGGRRGADLVLFEGPNYTGRSLEVRSDIDDLKRSGFNDRARSAKVYGGRWKLCRESDYRRCEHVTRDVPDLNALAAGGQISSVERE